MIESHLAGPVFGIDNDELLCAITKIIAIPEARILLEPMRRDLRLIHPSFGSAEPATTVLRRAIHPIRCGVAILGRGP